MSNAFARRTRILDSVAVTKREKKKVYLEKNIFSITSISIYCLYKLIVTYLLSLKLLFHIFYVFFDDELLQHIVKEMHKYIGMQKNPQSYLLV